MKNNKMGRKVEILLVASILLLVVSQQVYLLYDLNPTAGIFSSDYWIHVVSMRQYDAEQYINFDMTWTNIQRIEGEYQFYPPGFPLLANSLREVTGLGYYEISLLFNIFWPLFCVLIYLMARKATSNPWIAIVAMFCGATFISGSNMLGPMLPLASTLGIILLLATLLMLVSSSRNIARLAIMSILLAAMFVTHRVTIAMWLMIVPLISILPLLFVKQKTNFVYRFNVPIISATIVASIISLIFWLKMPMDQMMRFGGIIDFRIDEWILGHELNITTFIALVLLLIVVMFIIVTYLLSLSTRVDHLDVGPMDDSFISKRLSLLALLAFPLFFIGLIVYSSLKLTGGIPITPGSLLDYWGVLSEEAYRDVGVSNIKQLLYIWHINLIPMAFFPLAIIIILRGARRNYPMASAVSIITLLFLLIWISSSIEELKVQRAYLYVAPFTAIASAWAFVSFYRSKWPWRKHAAIALVIGSLAMSFAAIPYIASDVSNTDITGIYWLEHSGMADVPIATEGYSAGIGRGMGVMGLTVYDYSFGQPSSTIINMLRTDAVHATFVSSQLPMLHQRMQQPDVTLAFINGGTEVFVF